MIKFSLALLEKQPITLEGSEPAELLELDSESCFAAASPIRYRLVARSVSGGALVEGELAFAVSGNCGRCLNETTEEIESDLCLFFESPTGEELDITEEFREEALLALPMNLLCGEDCRGVCPVCGRNRNEKDCHCHADLPSSESPWQALDELEL